MRVTLSPRDTLPPRRRRSVVKKKEGSLNRGQDHQGPLKRWRRIVPEADCPEGTLCHVKQVSSWDCTEMIIYCIQGLSSFSLPPCSLPVRVSLHGEQLLPHLVPDPSRGPGGH